MNSSTLVLPPLSALYGAAVRARLSAYRRGFLSSSKLAAPVISVGNITVGGTGKTPLVEWVCKALAEEGRKTCVLTRGYRRANAASRLLVSDGHALLADEQAAGDEAFLLAQKLKGIAAVVCDSERFAAGKWAISELDVDAFVLDDGFQHLQLARDLNVLTIDATDPWGGNQLLPYGRLREPLTGMARADCAVITRANQSDSLSELVVETKRFIGDKPVFTSDMRTTRIRTLAGNKTDSMPQSTTAFCGLGNPNSFFTQCRESGLTLASTRAFADHHRYIQTEIDLLASDARRSGAEALITTAKDAVKLHELTFSMPCFVLDIEIVMNEADQFRAIIRSTLK